MTTITFPDVPVTKYWKPINQGAHVWLHELGKDLIAAGVPEEKIYLTESTRRVPMLVIKGDKRWCSVSWFNKQNHFRLFTNYTPGGRLMKKEMPQMRLWLGEQKRHVFKLPINSLILDFIKNEAWERYEESEERWFHHA